ncbi:hypothetical protein [Streptomyces sp. RG80]|uniref:hypothetical protein n=1 Tax=Streptomyces sp. RG80 TaxID=3157340 RepID=UPI00339006E8
MGAEASAVRQSGKKRSKRDVVIGGALAFALAVGALATLAAALASLLVDSLLAKRILWVTVAVGVSVGAGVWKAGHVMATPSGSGRLPEGSGTRAPR